MPTPCRTELMPGVWLTAVQTEQFKTACWSLQLLVPLSGETAALHTALPRILRWGTARYPSRERLEEALSGLYGGRVIPTAARFGEVHCAGFRGSFLDDRLTLDGKPYCDEVARLMGDLLLHPSTRSGRLNAAPVEAERTALLAEQSAAQEDRLAFARARLLEKMCRGEPYAVGPLGTPAGAKRVTQIRANRYHQELLPTVHIEVFYCGSLPPERVGQTWREALMGLPRAIPEGESERIPDTLLRTYRPPTPRCFTGRTEEKNLLTVGLCVGGAIQGGRTLPLLLLEDLLKRTPGVSTALDSVKGILIVQMAAGQEGIAALEAALEALRQGELSEEALEETQNRLARRFLALSDHPERLTDYWLEQIASGRRTTPEQAAALVYTVGREQIGEAARLTALDTVYLLPSTGEEVD